MAKSFDPPDIRDPFGAFSRAVIGGGGRTIYVKGQAALGPDGQIVGDSDIEAQVAQVLRNTRDLLGSMGGRPSDIVSLQQFTTDRRAFMQCGEIRARSFDAPCGAASAQQNDQISYAARSRSVAEPHVAIAGSQDRVVNFRALLLSSELQCHWAKKLNVLAVSYNVLLLAGAAAMAIITGFTGLSLANGLSRLPTGKRQTAIARAAVVLGGGIWSTHFVAMLALQLPVDVVYDPIYTLASALIAILMTGSALLVLHFAGRTPAHIAIAGVIMGLGVVAMHYVGMFGMRGCVPVFGWAGYAISTVLSILICTGALYIAYRRRTLRGLMIGGAVYGTAILAMHFSAMSQTGFLPLDKVEPTIRMVPNDVLAMLVIFMAFLICAAFLLTTATLTQPFAAAAEVQVTDEDPDPPIADTAVEDLNLPLRLPYEQEGRTFFAPLADVVAIRADGHYTRLYRVSGPVFCPQPIARLAEDLSGSRFVRTHRSHLVNVDFVQGFERRKDQGICLFAPEIGVEPVPVSRANVSSVRKALGL